MTIQEVQTLLDRLPRQILCSRDTPLTRMERLEQQIKAGSLYIKRDDLNGVGPGGNKVRPLEYLLGEARARSSDVIIASGQDNSNLCSIAASACCRLGMRCILVHNSKKPDQLSGNALLNALSQVEEHYIGSVSEKERNEYVDLLKIKLKQDGKTPYVIENGASTVHGAVGYLHLPMELMRQREDESAPITDLFVPGGNGGLAAGIVFGTALLNHPFNVHVITVEHTGEKLEQIIDSLTKGMEQYLGISLPVPVQSVMTVHGGYRGEGWGISTKESDHMISLLAREEGIFLEPVYTSKTLWGMCDLLHRGEVKSRGACMIHSGGFASLFYRNLISESFH